MEEDNSLESLKERKKKIISWLKKDYNLYFLGILVLALAIRLYYFSLTLDQPAWWDEAEYMNMARAWAFNLDYNFVPVRPVLFSLITALFFKIVETEFLPRFLEVILSTASVAGMYYLGKEMYNKKVGLIACFLMATFHLSLFYTSRLLVGVPSLTFLIFGILFFYKYFKTKSNKMLYWGASMIAIATLFRLSAAIFLVIVLIYFLITERLKFLKRKELYISAIIFLLILSPYLIWGYIQFDGFVISQAGAWNAPKDNQISNAWCNAKSYFNMLPSVFSWPLLLAFILGLFLMYELILGLDVFLKGGDFKLNKYFYLILLFIIPLISASFSIGNCYHEDRYILNSSPALFVVAGAFIINIFNKVKKRGKFLAILLLILLLGSIAYLQLQHADNLIKFKKDSYLWAKESGIWIRENSVSSDIVLTSSEPMTGYYSKRQVRGFPKSVEEMETLRESNLNLKYFMISRFQPSHEWTYSYPSENNLTLAKAYFEDPEQTQATVAIYNLR